jgi:hypothetical protein
VSETNVDKHGWIINLDAFAIEFCAREVAVESCDSVKEENKAKNLRAIHTTLAATDCVVCLAVVLILTTKTCMVLPSSWNNDVLPEEEWRRMNPP